MKDARGRTYIAIDLTSYFASVECVERGLDPLTTNLVVADVSRTEKTICLAVSPSLKAYGIGGRARLFEVTRRINAVNYERRIKLPGFRFGGKSVSDIDLKTHPDWEVDFIRATPRMSHYIDYSTKIYRIYLKYIAPEDIHVYSIDEVFIDATDYLPLYKLTAHELAMKMIRDVLSQTGITATAGIGTNMYLCKVAMDIVAKHIPADKNGVRIAELDEMSYRRKLWNHKPITDFWRIGKGIAQRLAPYGIDTMGKIARMSVDREEFFYKLFGVNAELIIDHAWGWEPCTIKEIKAYRPENTSLTAGQVLTKGYEADKARLVVQEMAEMMALDLVDKRLVCDQIVLTVGYDIDNKEFKGEREIDRYGRSVPKQAHGSQNIGKFTASSRLIVKAALELYDRIINPDLLVRRMYLVANHTTDEQKANEQAQGEQLDLFSTAEQKDAENAALEKEKSIQKTVLDLQKKFGKNAVLKGMNLQEGATAMERNRQIGGHKA